MQLAAGLVGMEQDTETLAIRPKIGWAVRDGSQIQDAATLRVRKAINSLIREWSFLEGIPGERVDSMAVKLRLHRSRNAIPDGKPRLQTACKKTGVPRGSEVRDRHPLSPGTTGTPRG